MRPLALAAAFAALTLPAFAADTTGQSGNSAIVIEDAYARASGPTARAGAAFFTIVNRAPNDDRLVAVASEAAERVELHTHIEDAAGVMRMIEVEDGFAVPASGTHALMRGGDHVMFMGLAEPWEQGATISVTLTFEQSGDMVVEIPIDLERMDGHGGHGAMNPGAATN